MIKKINTCFINLINIFFNIISLNKLPVKGSVTYFLLLLVGVISSIVIRYSYLNSLILPFPEYINNSIMAFSILYSLFLFFNYVLITANAFKLIDFFSLERKRNTTQINNTNIIFIGYYLYYFYVTFVTSFVVMINYYLFFKIFYFNFYILLLFIVFIVAAHFIFYTVNFNYDINKVLSFTGKLTLFSILSLILIYMYCSYNGSIIKFINHLSPFKTIYCESSSTRATNDLNNLTGTNDGPSINSNNTNSTNVNGNNNSNIGNSGIQPSNNTNSSTNTNRTTNNSNDQSTTLRSIRTSTQSLEYVQHGNNNFNNDNPTYLDSRSSTPTPKSMNNLNIKLLPQSIIDLNENIKLLTSSIYNLNLNIESLTQPITDLNDNENVEVSNWNNILKIIYEKNKNIFSNKDKEYYENQLKMFNLNSNSNSNSNSNFDHSMEIINNKDSVSKHPKWRHNYLTNNNYINNINEQIIEYYKSNIFYPDLQSYFLNDSFYGNNPEISDLNVSLSVKDIYILKVIHTRSFRISIKEITLLYDQQLIDLNKYHEYIYKLLTTILKQSSELNVLLNGILKDTDNYFTLDVLLNGELIYLNGENTYIRFFDDKLYCMDFKGLNNYELLKKVESFRNTYLSIKNTGNKFKMCDELLFKLKAKFLNVYGFEYSYNNYNKAILDDYYNDNDNDNDNHELINTFIDGTNNLIFQNKFDIFWFRYNYNGESIETIIQADSLFKLRYWIHNEQNNLIGDYKKFAIIEI